MSQEFINEEEVDSFRPMTLEQAAVWRKQFPQESVWQLLKIQCWVGLGVGFFALLLEWAFGSPGLTLSASYGALVVVFPAAVCARGLVSKFAGSGVAASVAKFFVWEFAKVALSVSMLAIAPKILLEDLRWPALIVGLVVTFKGFWAFVIWRHCFEQKGVK